MSKTLLIQDGDLVIGANGQPETVDGSTKRDLDIANVLLTPLDLTRPFGAFGNELFAALGDPTSLAAERIIYPNVTEAIERLRAYQRRDPNATPDERIAAIQDLTVRRLNNSRTSFVFLLRLRSESGETSLIPKKLTFGHRELPGDTNASS